MGNCMSEHIDYYDEKPKSTLSFVNGTSYNNFYEFIEYYFEYNIFTKADIQMKLKRINPTEFTEWTQYDSRVLDKILKVLVETKFLRHNKAKEIDYYSLMTFLDRTASLSEDEQSREIEEILHYLDTEKHSQIKKGHIEKFLVNSFKPHKLEVVAEVV